MDQRSRARHRHRRINTNPCGCELWRGDLSPLGREAAPNRKLRCIRYTAHNGFTAQPNGAVRRFAKSPRHSSLPHSDLCRAQYPDSCRALRYAPGPTP
ncbi:hypothetical protein EYC95_15295 [Pseudomonas sp. BGI-2]|nr:hypothetical protein EYC95_15295 [Pseudomonas sp. BGI-2]